MSRWIVRIAGLGALAMVVGCASIQSTSISEIKSGPGHRIYADDTGHGFLGVTLPPLDAITKLKAQCQGTITGIHTVTWVRNYAIIQHYREEATGWCQNI